MGIAPRTASAPLVVTSEWTVDSDIAEALWDLYAISFEPLQHRAAARQLISRADFDLEVLDPRVTKYIARIGTGRIVGFCTLSNDLTTVPWISPEFYQARYPSHSARRAVFYCGIAVVHPDARSTRAFAEMVSAFGRDIAAADGILAADMCRFNVDVVQLTRTVSSMMERAWGSAKLVELDSQMYMAWEPDENGPGRRAGRRATVDTCDLLHDH